MSQNTLVFIAMVIVTAALASGAVVVVSNRLLREDADRPAEPERGSEAWRPVTAEVVSILRAGNRTFLQVRYRAGRSLIRNDLLYPARTPVPVVGQRVRVRYDPSAPARAVYDPHQPAADRPARVTETDSPGGPVTRGPLMPA